MVFLPSFLEFYLVSESSRIIPIPPRQKRPADIALGRFQPPTNGHLKLFKRFKNHPIIVLVKGEKTSQDKQRNPLPVDYQKYLLMLVMPKATILVSNSGYIPQICSIVREAGFEPATIFAGSDRIRNFENQMVRFSKQIPLDKDPFTVKFVQVPRPAEDISATKVRKSIRQGNFNQFKKMVPKALWPEWNNLRRYLTLKEEFVLEESLNTPYPWKYTKKTPNSLNIEWLAEKSGIRYVMMFDKDILEKDSWECYFIAKNGGPNAIRNTGTGDQFRVFATVFDIISDFLKRYSPNKLVFTGDKSLKKAKLYTAILARNKIPLRKLGYNITFRETEAEVEFHINKQKSK